MSTISSDVVGSMAPRLDPRTKLLYLVWVFAIVSVLSHPVILLLLFLVTLAPIFASHLSPWTSFKEVRIGLFVAAASWLLWLIFLRHQGDLLFSMGSLHVTKPGFFNGASVAIRIVAILMAFVAVFKTTTSRAVMTALYHLRVSVPFAMVVGITLRLIPQLKAEHAIILEAQRSRAVEFEKGGLVSRLRKHMAYIIPLVLRALRITSDLSLALETRAFDPYAQRSFSEELEFRSADWILLTSMAISLTASIGARIAGFGGMPLAWTANAG
jgi:energy-coupling factor transport system permease protein